MLISHGYIGGAEFTEQTLREYVKAKSVLCPKNAPVPRKRFEKEHVNELWISDFMHGPNIKKQKTFLCCIIDDHSRVITGYGWYHKEL
jgi:transposase InsO family protein